MINQQLDVWVKKSDGSPAKGVVWPSDPTYFGDFSHPNAFVRPYNSAKLISSVNLSYHAMSATQQKG